MSESDKKHGNRKLSHKFKDLMKKTKKSISEIPKQIAEEFESSIPDKTPTVESFEPASPSLDIMEQARENLTRFKNFLESNPANPGEFYDIVYQTMSRAFSEFTNRTADLEIKLNEAKTAASDFDDKLSQNQERKSELQKRITDIIAEKRSLNKQIEALKKEQLEVQGKIDSSKQQKHALRDMTEEYAKLQETLKDEEEKYDVEVQKTVELEQKLTELQIKVQQKEKEVEADLEASEARIKELTAKARQAELIERQIQQAKREAEKPLPQPAPEPVTVSTYVINDNVKVSPQEKEHLKFMIMALKSEITELKAERDSRMMDIDCLMQENLGLKQIIRNMMENQ